MAIIWTATADADKYQIHRSWNPGRRESTSTGIAISVLRLTDESSGGIVLPSAWNMLDVTKTTPDAMKIAA